MVRRRKQLLVHSHIYYTCGDSIITDKQFDKWAYELKRLNAEHPNLVNVGEWSEAFTDWDATTGFNLPIHSSWVQHKAEQLLSHHNK